MSALFVPVLILIANGPISERVMLPGLSTGKMLGNPNLIYETFSSRSSSPGNRKREPDAISRN